MTTNKYSKIIRKGLHLTDERNMKHRTWDYFVFETDWLMDTKYISDDEDNVHKVLKQIKLKEHKLLRTISVNDENKHFYKGIYRVALLTVPELNINKQYKIHDTLHQ